ncbi:unnamed protein product [Amoebophrya sp. A25]|nr:unnamed protein product [Amoebophrya sp. A25]|eukprot:GSA25T00012395001.1
MPTSRMRPPSVVDPLAIAKRIEGLTDHQRNVIAASLGSEYSHLLGTERHKSKPSDDKRNKKHSSTRHATSRPGNGGYFYRNYGDRDHDAHLAEERAMLSKLFPSSGFGQQEAVLDEDCSSPASEAEQDDLHEGATETKKLAEMLQRLISRERRLLRWTEKEIEDVQKNSDIQCDEYWEQHIGRPSRMLADRKEAIQMERDKMQKQAATKIRQMRANLTHQRSRAGTNYGSASARGPPTMIFDANSVDLDAKDLSTFAAYRSSCGPSRSEGDDLSPLPLPAGGRCGNSFAFLDAPASATRSKHSAGGLGDRRCIKGSSDNNKPVLSIDLVDDDSSNSSDQAVGAVQVEAGKNGHLNRRVDHIRGRDFGKTNSRSSKISSASARAGRRY